MLSNDVWMLVFIGHKYCDVRFNYFYVGSIVFLYVVFLFLFTFGLSRPVLPVVVGHCVFYLSPINPSLQSKLSRSLQSPWTRPIYQFNTKHCKSNLPGIQPFIDCYLRLSSCATFGVLVRDDAYFVSRLHDFFAASSFEDFIASHWCDSRASHHFQRHSFLD